MTVPDDAHEWLSFEDATEQRTWLFDVTFLTSTWHCIFGAGCQGVYTEPNEPAGEGCCTYGAHFTDDDDVHRVEVAAKALSNSEWQFRAKGRQRGVTKRKDGETTTRLVDGACIFLNRPGFPGGPGCALHRHALEHGLAPMSTKPDVCWQLPLRREDTTDAFGHVTSKVSEWKRRHWGPAGEEFAWWCTESPAAFGAKSAVYESLSAELIGLVGQPVYERMATALNERRSHATLLPHPVFRKRLSLD